jgi:hypothetical protein
MPFTDRSDLFGAVHEEGINRVVRHIMRQRPSLFNYATPFFKRRPDLLCVPIQAAQSVTDARNPLFTEQKPLPILGAALDIGLNFCLQLTDVQIDFHPGNAITLPPQLGTLPAQRLALRFRACFGIDCPSDDVVADYINRMEQAAIRKGDLIVPLPEPRRLAPGVFAPALSAGTSLTAMTPVRRRIPLDDMIVNLDDRVFDTGFGRDEPATLPTRALLCTCLELFAVAHVEWGKIGSDKRQWLKPRLDGIEIVDLQPNTLEDSIECFLKTTLRLGILPRLVVPMETLILDITAMLEKQGATVGQQISLRPTPVSPQLPNNPAIEADQLKAFINLVVEEA